MKRILSSLVVLAVLTTVSNSARAEETTTEDTLEVGVTTTDLVMRPNQQRRILGQLFLLPVYFMASISVHEGSHALLGLATGMEVTGFKPYPHYADRNGERNFVLGFTEISGMEEAAPWQIALTASGPFIADTLLFTIGDLLLTYAVDPHSVAAPFLWAGTMIIPLVDFVMGLNCMSDYCDMSLVAENSGITRGALMVVGYSMAFVAAWRILHQARRMFMEPRSTAERRARSVSVSPITSDTMVGIGVSGGF